MTELVLVLVPDAPAVPMAPEVPEVKSVWFCGSAELVVIGNVVEDGCDDVLGLSGGEASVGAAVCETAGVLDGVVVAAGDEGNGVSDDVLLLSVAVVEGD